jgi:hypothetical protein
MPAMLLAAEVWHYWIGWAVSGLAVLAVVATIIGYLLKVERIKHPRR